MIENVPRETFSKVYFLNTTEISPDCSVNPFSFL